jgi:hypothetical protein
VAVLFAPNNKQHEVKQTINGTEIKLEKSARFLGVEFDRGLSWRPHVDYVTERCRKRFNLMRAVSGSSWGADEKTLLRMYRTLIRPVVD